MHSILLQTYLSGFRLDEAMSPLVSFSVARRTNQTASIRTLTYDRVSVDTSGSWYAVSPSVSYFVAPRTGLYFLHYSVGTTLSTRHLITLNVNNVSRQRLTDGKQLQGVPITNNGIDMLGRCALIQLQAGDKVSVGYTGDAPYSDAITQPIALSGFLYSPISGSQASTNNLLVGRCYSVYSVCVI